MQDEAEQKAKIDREQANELEYVDESQKADSTATASGSSGNAGGKPVRNPEREKPKWKILLQTECFIGHIHLSRKRS